MSRIKQRLLALLILFAGLKFCFPIYQHIYKLYVRSFQENLKAGWEKPTKIEQHNSQEHFNNQHQLPRRLADNAEIIFVSGYESDRSLNSDKVKVNIDRPYQNVLLVLSSYDRVDWDVEASPNTNITGIILSSDSSSTVVANTDSTKVYTADFPYSSEIENKNFVVALEQLNRWFDVDKVDAFRGSYSLPGEISISELDPLDPALTLAGYPIEKSITNFPFNFHHRNYESVKWTSPGAVTRSKYIPYQTGVALSPNGEEIYELTNTGIKITNKKNSQTTNFKLPNKFSELSWGTDIAYDSKRNIVSLTSLGGKGYFYRFDVKKRRWLDARSLGNVDIKSLSYDPLGDRYVAWVEDYGANKGNLLFISNDGELLHQERISDRMKGFYRLYDKNNEMTPTLEIVAHGNDIALIAHNNSNSNSMPFNSSSRSIKSVWHYDLDTQTVKLTYKSSAERDERTVLYSD